MQGFPAALREQSAHIPRVLSQHLSKMLPEGSVSLEAGVPAAADSTRVLFPTFSAEAAGPEAQILQAAVFLLFVYLFLSTVSQPFLKVGA